LARHNPTPRPQQDHGKLPGPLILEQPLPVTTRPTTTSASTASAKTCSLALRSLL
jgi:hypothetical protein